MSILDKIIANKREEVARAKVAVPVEELKKEGYYTRRTLSLKQRLLEESGSGIIAEFKRKSPSKGEIHPGASVEAIVEGYSASGAAGISVLTDSVFFGGSREDLVRARAVSPVTPLLRKDFMIDEYQLHEARAWGADVILLIAANLDAEEILQLSRKAKELDLEVLLEIHDREELERSPLDFVDILGVNNRNLKNFSENNVDASLNLVAHLPETLVKISESCISRPETVRQLKAVGYRGFLMGENFMKTEDPAGALRAFGV
ncbi:MAG: indole-3-glycerol phosphate synthase TrpC [Leadbetterella sp.]|nr:indole-3-glycerol phosphate synthase TrpC [Leadbetterella sp.]